MDIFTYLKIMAKKEASDLYLTVGFAPSCRVQGEVLAIDQDVMSAENVNDLIYSILSDEQKRWFEDDKELNFAISFPQLGRFRFNLFMQRGSMGAVVRRVLSQIPTLEDLGLPDAVHKMVNEKRGLILIVGATGSGKSTTLASMIKHRSEIEKGHIISIEDPIEYLHNHAQSIITQREVGSDTVTYAEALKNALRQAPDVVAIGEIRNEESMMSALHFVETGHLCLATLHATNSYHAVERILNFFKPEQAPQILYQLSQSLHAIMAQRLIKSREDERVLICDILINTPRVADLIQKQKLDEIRTTIEEGQVHGMQSFDQHLFALVQSGKISQDEALRFADRAHNLRVLLDSSSTQASTAELSLKKSG
jgi:twitching motility protein PilU